MQKRRSFKQTLSLKDRLTAYSENMRQQAKRTKSAAEREELMRAARRAEMSSQLDEGLTSPGLRMPT